MAKVRDVVEEAIQVIEKVGRALNARNLIRVAHAHASGISYSNIGKYGLEFIEGLAEKGARVRVFSTFNPVGISLDERVVADLGEAFTKNSEEQWRIIRALLSMGFHFSATCIPYAIRSPRQGEHLAWGESSAAAMANLFFGAYCNKEAGPISLLAAIAGYTYNGGLHLDEERTVKVVIEVEELKSRSEYSALGVLAARLSRGCGVKITMRNKWSCGFTCAKLFAAAYATFTSNVFAVIDGVTPSNNIHEVVEEKHVVDRGEIVEVKDKLSNTTVDDVDVFFTGCPHMTLGEALEVIRLVEKAREKKPGRKFEIWIGVPGYYSKTPWWPQIRDHALKRGVRLLAGTCPIVASIKGIVNAIATDSAKAVYYLRVRHGVKVVLADIEEYLGLRRDES